MKVLLLYILLHIAGNSTTINITSHSESIFTSTEGHTPSSGNDAVIVGVVTPIVIIGIASGIGAILIWKYLKGRKLNLLKRNRTTLNHEDLKSDNFPKISSHPQYESMDLENSIEFGYSDAQYACVAFSEQPNGEQDNEQVIQHIDNIESDDHDYELIQSTPSLIIHTKSENTPVNSEARRSESDGNICAEYATINKVRHNKAHISYADLCDILEDHMTPVVPAKSDDLMQDLDHDS